MQISTSEFLLGSVNDLMQQEQNVNTLDREIASGETMLDASSDPGGAANVIGLANQVGTLAYDTANGQAATQTLQEGVSALVAAPRMLTRLIGGDQAPCGPDVWGETWLHLPEPAASPRWLNVFTGENLVVRWSRTPESSRTVR